MTNTIPSPSPAGQRVALLVDGDADTRSMYAEYLRLSSTWLVEEATDGREALAKAIRQCPTVVVTETRLPGMSGFDLCQILRPTVSPQPSRSSSLPVMGWRPTSGARECLERIRCW